MNIDLGNWADTPAHIWKLALALLIALPVAWDREREERTAGLRTFTVVSVASCAYIIATERVVLNTPESLARIVQGLITGIGFIGSGAILKLGNGVVGTATAASIWATGAIGVAVALSQYDIAVSISVITFLALRWLKPQTKQKDGSES
ncbi:MAG: MgtC/SapB family protein [Bryobacteraceae bacterium]|nr:MgtC/SapB family protein [Bryobacteraceae bacterium]